MKFVLRVPALVWLLLSYAILITALYQSATSTATNGLPVYVFFLSFFSIWIPAYLYARRREILQNKSWWFSRGAALLVVVITVLLFAPWINEVIERSQAAAQISKSWWGIFGALSIYMLVIIFGFPLIAWVFKKAVGMMDRTQENK